MNKRVKKVLATIVENVAAAGLKPPCIIVVGEVVTLREKLKWFENRPLFGKRIVVTRARKQASDMVSRLSALGAQCLEYPAIKIAPPADFQALDQAIDHLSQFDWLVFTSVNGVDRFFDRLFANQKDVRGLGHIQTACIGPATAERLFNFGLFSDIVPESYRAESVIEAFKNIPVKGKRVLLPRAAEARPILPEELTKMGAIVDEIPAYHTTLADEDSSGLLDALSKEQVDMITFTSSSTVTNFKALLPSEHFEALISGVTIAAIGPITADTAAKNGFSVDLVAEEYTVPGLCDAICRYFTS